MTFVPIFKIQKLIQMEMIIFIGAMGGYSYWYHDGMITLKQYFHEIKLF